MFFFAPYLFYICIFHLMISDNVYSNYIQADNGYWIVQAVDEYIRSISYTDRLSTDNWRNSPLLTTACNQLKEYFNGDRRSFDLPLYTEGYPDFYRTVWEVVAEIPYGKTISYSDVAISLGNPQSVRAVGMANGKNPFPIVIPCHRVMGKDRSLTGYAYGVDLKRSLLIHEGAIADQKTLF